MTILYMKRNRKVWSLESLKFDDGRKLQGRFRIIIPRKSRLVSVNQLRKRTYTIRILT